MIKRKGAGDYIGMGALWCAWLLGASPVPAELVSSFQAGDGGWHLGSLAVGNLDGSAQKAIVIPYRNSSGNWCLDAFKYTGERLPAFPYTSGTEELNVSPTLYDLNGDGQDEILFTRANRVIAMRANGSVIWSTTVDASNYVPNGGYMTVTNGFYWYPGGAWMSRLPSSAVFSSQVSPPVVKDLAGNGNYEVITAWKINPDPYGSAQDYNPLIFPIYGVGEWGTMGEDWSGGIVTFNASNGAQTFVYHLHHLVESGLAVGRALPSGPLKIYELNDSDTVVCFDKSQPFGLFGKGMLHRQFGKNQRLISGAYQFPIDVYTADLDGDGLDELLVAGTQPSNLWQPNETILDDDGAVLWRRWLPHLDIPNVWGWLNSASLIPCNPDHDNHVDVLGFNHSYEITFRYWNGIELVNRPGWPKNFYPYLPTPPVVGDVDGDGAEEIVIGTYNPAVAPSSGSLYVFGLDGTLKQNVPVPGGLKHIPALSDVEGNGRLDVIYRSLAGTVYVQNFGATRSDQVSWAMHRGNAHRDGNQSVSLYPPGTPLVTKKVSACRHVTFCWTNSATALAYRIFRAEQPEGPFALLASVPPDTTAYTDTGLKPGWQYIYEVRAVYPGGVVASAPFPVLSLHNNNLVANGGFEEDDNSHWDKWFTGSIELTNMCVSTNVSYQGRRSMQIRLQNQGNNSTISQYNQYGIPSGTLYVTPGAFYSYGGFLKSGGISQPSEHWFEWYSSKTGWDTNNRPELPWPFYETPHFAVGAGPTEWTYVNRTFQLPAGFPNVELRHRYTITAPGSGSVYIDNVFFREIPPPTATNWTTWISFNSYWKFSASTPSGNWYATNFNDSGWILGQAKFGAGSGPQDIRTPVTQYQPAYYFRKNFVVSSAEVEDILLSATCTDSKPARLWLNGMEVLSPLDITTLQGNDLRYFDLTPFASLLHAGTNTIAVQLPNTAGSDYDDVAFDLRLQVIACKTLQPRLSIQSPATASARLVCDTPAGTLWNLQASEKLNPCEWQTIQTFTNTAGQTVTLQDAISRSPGTNRARFYRLVPF